MYSKRKLPFQKEPDNLSGRGKTHRLYTLKVGPKRLG